MGRGQILAVLAAHGAVLAHDLVGEGLQRARDDALAQQLDHAARARVQLAGIIDIDGALVHAPPVIEGFGVAAGHVVVPHAAQDAADQVLIHLAPVPHGHGQALLPAVLLPVETEGFRLIGGRGDEDPAHRG